MLLYRYCTRLSACSCHYECRLPLREREVFVAIGWGGACARGCARRCMNCWGIFVVVILMFLISLMMMMLLMLCIGTGCFLFSSCNFRWALLCSPPEHSSTRLSILVVVVVMMFLRRRLSDVFVVAVSSSCIVPLGKLVARPRPRRAQIKFKTKNAGVKRGPNGPRECTIVQGAAVVLPPFSPPLLPPSP